MRAPNPYIPNIRIFEQSLYLLVLIYWSISRYLNEIRVHNLILGGGGSTENNFLPTYFYYLWYFGNSSEFELTFFPRSDFIIEADSLNRSTNYLEHTVSINFRQYFIITEITFFDFVDPPLTVMICRNTNIG